MREVIPVPRVILLPEVLQAHLIIHASALGHRSETSWFSNRSESLPRFSTLGHVWIKETILLWTISEVFAERGGGELFFSLYAFTQISHLPFHVMRFNMGIYILNLLRLFTTFCLTNYLVISPEYSPVLQSTHAFLVCARHVPHIYKDLNKP
jgi:hypothetical protein